MRRMLLVVPLFLTLASSAVSPVDPAIRLDWGRLTMLLKADSVRGTLIWVSRSASIQQNVVAYIDPAAAYQWTQELRQFLALSLTSADTGTLRTSPLLRSRSGDGIYFVRLKHEGSWTDDRLIVMEGSSAEAGRLVIEGTEENAIEFLEALESVNTQALNLSRTTVVDTIRILNPLDTGTGPVVQRDPPEIRYPAGARREGINGDVWVSYVVTAAGNVDPASIEVLLSDGRPFNSSVSEALVHTRFTPAHRNGAPISIRVFQRFSFRIIRCKGRDAGSTRMSMFVESVCGPPETR